MANEWRTFAKRSVLRCLARSRIVKGMKVLLLLLAMSLFLLPPLGNAGPPSCLIVRHASGFSAFANNANWEYVAGDFPGSMEWKGHLTDRNMRKVKKLGGRVIILQRNYTSADLEQAKASCLRPE